MSTINKQDDILPPGTKDQFILSQVPNMTNMFGTWLNVQLL